MAETRAPRPVYDAIADLYDVDMARNMAFDDVGFYAELCRATPGPVLELGCGNGRILLELVARGLDVTGADGSHRMLAALIGKAAARGWAPPRVARMDVRALGLRGGFAVVLCPYSLVTYMSGHGDAARLVGEARRVVVDGGAVVVDAFVPRPASATAEFRQDYTRPLADGTLVRSKRVTPLSPAINRIERRYDVLNASGRLVRRVETSEDIRPFAPDEITALLEEGGLRLRSTAWDYGAAPSRDGAQYFTAVAQAG